MNNTNPLYQELTALRAARELEDELRHIRLQHEAEPAPSGWTAHHIAHFAEWMISTGESLRQRYDHASMHDCAPGAGALAR
ncbi:MAG: hypothetical protein AB1750_06170 [Chloroflexota bacterium]